MVARHISRDEDDFAPTPPFATRALYEHVAPSLKRDAIYSGFCDPAAGAGHMMDVAREYNHTYVCGSDVNPRRSDVLFNDFLESEEKDEVIVTNPPYKHLIRFMEKGLELATCHFALLVRVQALEGQNRFYSVYSKNPPTNIGFFSDRIPFKMGKVVRKAPKMFFHVWLHWDMGTDQKNPPIWIPPTVQQELEKDSDYD